MKYWLFFLIIIATFLPERANGQSPDILLSAQKQLRQQQHISDSIVNALIKISNDSLSNDSTKVGIIFFLSQESCDLCLMYLVENISDIFSYGHGFDQAAEFACLSALLRIARKEQHIKWRLIPFCFNSLIYKRDPRFVTYIRRVLVEIDSKKVIKEMIEDEIMENEGNEYEVYRKNLQQILNEIRG